MHDIPFRTERHSFWFAVILLSLGLILVLPNVARASGSTVSVPPPNGTDDTANIQAALNACAFCALPSANRAQVPVYEVTPVESTIKFGVESSVPIKGTFEKWNASMTFSSTDVRSGVLDIEIQADSVDTGSGMKNNKLKSKDFFNVKDSPMITFKSTKVVQTGPNTFDLEGDFTIRGVTKTEKLTLTDNGKGSTSGSIAGTMAFDRKDYGMNSNIPLIKIANRIEVNVSLKWKRVSGPPPVFQQ
jgi:polyisoprenoid-binding protein YceI